MSSTHLRLLSAVLALALTGSCVSLRSNQDIAGSLERSDFVRLDLPWGTQEVYLQRWGDVASEPLVLLHGFGASSHAWRLVAPQLAGRFLTLAPDLNGFGYTPRPADFAAYTIEGQAHLVLAAMDRLGIRRAHFAGHSYGGGLALWLARQHPERVRSLVLLDSARPTYSDERRSAFARFRPLVSASVRGVYLKDRYVRRSLERNFFDPRKVTDDLVRAYADRLRVEGVVRAYQGLSVPRRVPATLGGDFDYAAVRQSALVIWGEDDRLIPLAEARLDVDRMPHARLLVFPGCGHIPMEEKPAETAAAMLAFLAAEPRG